MTTADTRHLLDSKQVASFVARGFLRFDEIVPRALCEEATAEIAAGTRPSHYQAKGGEPASRWPGKPLDEVWPDSVGIAAILHSPAIAGIIQSLVGPRAIYDHHYAHAIEPNQRWSQPWHADAIVDPRTAFDIQLFFFFQDTPRAMGGTMILPGSHLRRVNESDIARYQNFVGQIPTVCNAGTLLVCHHGLWHCGQPNITQTRRVMLKLRLNPSVPQRLLWNTARSRRRRNPRHPRQPRAVARQRGPPRGREPHQTVAAPDRRHALRRRLLAHAPGKPGGDLSDQGHARERNQL